jgi:hypothetical protein
MEKLLCLIQKENYDICFIYNSPLKDILLYLFFMCNSHLQEELHIFLTQQYRLFSNYSAFYK